MAVLILMPEHRSALKELREFAENNPYTMDDLFDIHNGDALPPGEVDGYWCTVPIGVKVVFTIEMQKYKVRHLSMSTPRGLPPPPFVLEVMKLLGFESKDFSTCHVSTENNNTAINIVEVVTE